METTTASSNKDKSPLKDVYSIITGRIISLLEQGTVPWRQPWTDAGIPRNLISKRPYRGINVMLLSMLGYEQNYFLTYNQLRELGGTVRAGEKPHMAVFWNYLEVSRRHPQPEETEKSKNKVPFLRYYLVYNIAQCNGIPKAKIPVVSRALSPIPFCEQITEQMPQRPVIKHGSEQKAYYNPLHDFVNMPKFSSFESAESYYATLFHELIHSTGHELRCNRKHLLQMKEFNLGDAYSHEELVAEIGSCYLLSFAGITSQLKQSAGYISGWLERLRSNKKFIFSASTHAQKATDFILNFPNERQPFESPKPDHKVGLFFKRLGYEQSNYRSLSIG